MGDPSSDLPKNWHVELDRACAAGCVDRVKIKFGIVPRATLVAGLMTMDDDSFISSIPTVRNNCSQV
jgi:hypothetical protein